jgi:hypothetical protein
VPFIFQLLLRAQTRRMVVARLIRNLKFIGAVSIISQLKKKFSGIYRP